MSYKSVFSDQMTQNLIDAFLSIKNRQECIDFLEDICTVNEIKALAQRFEVANMLQKNSTYHEIVEQTHASTATISRVNRALNYGSDGYKIILERLNNK